MNPGVHPAPPAAESAFRGNQLYENGSGATPIDLGNDGPTPNDVGDVDEGANRLQNSPEFIAAQTEFNEVTGDLEVRYRVNTNEGDATYPLTVDFYLLTEIGGFADVYVGSDVYPAASATLYRSVAITPPSGIEMSGDAPGDGHGCRRQHERTQPRVDSGSGARLRRGDDAGSRWSARRPSRRGGR